MSISEKKIKAQSKKYKKFLETVFPFYPYKTEKKMYTMIRYSRKNTGTGNLLLTVSGDIVSREEAIPIYKDYIAYDSCVLDCKNHIAREKELSIKPHERVKNLLNHAVLPVSGDNEQKDIEKILAAANAYIFAKQRFQEIYDENVEIDTRVQEEQEYLTKEDVDEVRELNKEWVLLNYDCLSKRRAALDAYTKLESFCKENSEQINNELKDSAEELQQVLRALTDSKGIEALKNSLEEFEVDETGQTPRVFSEGEKGITEYSELYDQTVKYKFKTDVLPLLRNP